MGSRLCELPDELLVSCLEHISGRLTLCRVAATCKKLQALAESILYRKIPLHSYEDWTFFQTRIDSNPRRAEFVHIIDALSLASENNPCHSEGHLLRKIISRSRSLRELIVDTNIQRHSAWKASGVEIWPPLFECFYDIFAEAAKGLVKPSTDFQPLQSLRKLSLHRYDQEGRYWNINDVGDIFALPRLQELILTHADVTATLTKAVDHLPLVPLESLEMHDCIVSCAALENLLERPRALRFLYLEQKLKDESSMGSLCNDDVVAFFRVLQLQHQSIERFSFFTVDRQTPADSVSKAPTALLDGSTEGFSNFVRLEEIILAGECQNIHEALTVRELVPPNLKILHVSGAPCFIHATYLSIVRQPSLVRELTNRNTLLFSRLLRFSQAISNYPFLVRLSVSSRELFGGPAATWRQQAIDQASAEMIATSIHFRVYQEAWYPGAMPSRVKREGTLQQILIFDSCAGGWQVDKMRKWGTPT